MERSGDRKQPSAAIDIRQPLLPKGTPAHSPSEGHYLGRSPHRVYRRQPSALLDAGAPGQPSPETNDGIDSLFDSLIGQPRPPEAHKTQRAQSFSRRTSIIERWKGWIVGPKQAWQAVRNDPKSAVLACKVGFTCALASLLVIIQPLESLFFDIGIWAVITIALVYEASIGASFSKGLNRVTGTFLAGAFAVLINHVGPLTGAFHPYFVLLSIFILTAVLAFLRFRKGPLKEHWNYALSMAVITAHLLILSGYKQEEEKYMKPLLRFCMIVFGFLLAALVNLAIKPAYAGDSLHALVVKNFGVAADVLERCTEEYIKGKALQHVPAILYGNQEDDQIHRMYHEVVMSDSEVDRLMANVAWEPCHGPFFREYPWDLYDDITDNLRYTLYTIIALDSSLRAEVQAQLALRAVFAPEMQQLSSHVAALLKALGTSMKKFQHISVEPILQRAEEAALALQLKLYHNAQLLLLGTSPLSSLKEDAAREASENSEEDDASFLSPRDAPATNRDGLDLELSEEDLQKAEPSRVDRGAPIPENDAAALKEEGQGDEPSSSRKGLVLQGGNGVAPWQKEFMQRRESLGRHWEGTLERISALSLVKFASLLIEVVAGLKFVIESVNVLAERARFKNSGLGKPSNGTEVV